MKNLSLDLSDGATELQFSFKSKMLTFHTLYLSAIRLCKNWFVYLMCIALFPPQKRKKVVFKLMVFSKICAILKLNIYMNISEVSVLQMELKYLK